MDERTNSFITCWRQLNLNEKRKCYDALKIIDEKAFLSKEKISVETAKSLKATATSTGTTKIYEELNFFSYYSRLYYYPTIHWELDKTPDTNDYWVGIYRVQLPDPVPDDQYITYKYIDKVAQGSYYVGKLNTPSGVKSTFRDEKFELRIFKGESQRLDAVSNILHGLVHSPKADINDENLVKEIELPPISPKLTIFLDTLESENYKKEFKGLNASPEMLRQHWNQFNPHEKQLLLPILEHESLPNEIRYPQPTFEDRPEPKLLFPKLGKVNALEEAVNPVAEPTEIVLSFSLNTSYTYVYPVINTIQTLPGEDAYMGVYYPSSDGIFDPDNYIDNDWQYVGPGHEYETKLNYIKEEEQSMINNHYIGVVFDSLAKAYTQIGYTNRSIQATISNTTKAPKPKFIPEFDVQIALTNAHLCELAYKSYDDIQEEIKKYNMCAIMEIYDESTDTHGFVAEGKDNVAVVFRGTASIRNIFSDVWFVKKKVIDSQPERCHAGFVNAFKSVYQSVHDCIIPFLQSTKEIIFTGHSLGGALASLMIFSITLKYKSNDLKMFVYGCPPVGEISFSNYFKSLPSNVITIEGDPISSGYILLLGEWGGLYKPLEIFYLAKSAGHEIKDYIRLLEELNMKKIVKQEKV